MPETADFRHGSLLQRLSGYAMPAETEPHDRTLIGFPCRAELWGDRLHEARLVWVELAKTVAAYEPVTLLVNPTDAKVAGDLARHPNIEIVEIPLNDSWLRDNAATYVVSANGPRIGIDFSFNGWGEKYLPFDSDNSVPTNLGAITHEEIVSVDLVLEGGSITVDGQGTLVTTQQCLLNPNRNPTLTRYDIEQKLRDSLGVETIVWLPYSINDRDTDGHVDLVAAFFEPGKLLWQGCTDKSDENYENLRISKRCIDKTLDAKLRPLQTVELPVLPYCEVNGERFAVPYANLYACNGAVIVPVTGHPADKDMLEIIGDCYKGREVVPFPGEIIAFGGGGPHCATQQVPKSPLPTPPSA